MDDPIGRLGARTGVERTAAQSAVGDILEFVPEEGPTPTVPALVQCLPGADAVVLLASNPGSKLFGPIGGFARGGFAIGGPAAGGIQTLKAALNLNHIRVITREIMSVSHENAGEDAVGKIAGALPGLGQYV